MLINRTLVAICSLPFGMLIATSRADSPAPPSTLIVIEDHAETFFRKADDAFDSIKKIGQQDELWRNAQQASQQAAANPNDKQAKLNWMTNRFDRRNV